MKKIELTPEALKDLGSIKEYLDSEFGVKREKEILKAIMKDIRRLEQYPETDIKLFERFGIVTDYKCIYTNQNYVFYRIEDKAIKVVRVLSVKRDFMFILLGIKMSSTEDDDF